MTWEQPDSAWGHPRGEASKPDSVWQGVKSNSLISTIDDQDLLDGGAVVWNDDEQSAEFTIVGGVAKINPPDGLAFVHRFKVNDGRIAKKLPRAITTRLLIDTIPAALSGITLWAGLFEDLAGVSNAFGGANYDLASPRPAVGDQTTLILGSSVAGSSDPQFTGSWRPGPTLQSAITDLGTGHASLVNSVGSRVIQVTRTFNKTLTGSFVYFAWGAFCSGVAPSTLIKVRPQMFFSEHAGDRQ